MLCCGPLAPKNRCTGKPDGLYILPDVFKYLECKGGQEILHFCPSKQIFVPDTKQCRAVVPSDRGKFFVFVSLCIYNW